LKMFLCENEFLHQEKNIFVATLWTVSWPSTEHLSPTIVYGHIMSTHWEAWERPPDLTTAKLKGKFLWTNLCLVSSSLP
jgi:hypothetical protein